MNQRYQHARSGSHGRKGLPSHARPSKPPPLTRRGNSYNSAHSRPHSSGKPGSSGIPRRDETSRPDGSDEETMPGFEQFCATCERQIATPGQVLYCSEACRKRDVSTSDSFGASVPSPPLTPSTSSFFDYSHYSHVDILPQRSPTVLRPLSQSFADLSLDLNAFDSHDFAKQQNSHRKSDSAQSLSDFYSSLSNPATARRHVNRASTDGGMPSLSHSPSSSYGTVYSHASYQRPLLPRQYTSSSTTKSIDLVLPRTTTTPSSPVLLLKDASVKSSASTLTSFRVAEAERSSSRSTSPTELHSPKSLRQFHDPHF